MNGLAKYLYVTAMLVCLPYAAFALPGAHDPLTGGRNYTCNSCHTANATLGSTGYDNICLSCHNPSQADPLTGKRMKAFTAADFANPYGTYTTARPAILYQTSHKWSGKDTVPKAGALPPLDPYNTIATSFDVAKGMNKKSLKGAITCARCHNVHGDSAYTSVETPFLRSANDKDQMCLDCHRPRNSKSHMLGSHPVNVSYTSARVKGSAAFKKDSVNSSIPPTNPDNRTAEMKVKSGLVVCSTCHGVHYADSNSRTFDNYSNSVLGNLSTSKGYLLRTDLRGPSANSVNICSNCHNKPNHKKRGQNIQCADCHGGHVDALDGTVPNTYVVRRYMNVSTSKGAVRNKAAFYQYTGNRRNWNSADPAKPGVCQSCHIVPTGGAYPSEHADVSGSNGKLCMSCHVHDSADGAFSASCTTCHGYPPQDNHGGGPTGHALDGVVNYALQPFYKDETNTPHTAHAGGSQYSYNCSECHKGNSHNSGSTFQDVFISADASLTSNGQGTTPSYTPNNNAGPGTCTTYCHSNAKPAIGAYVTKTPQWKDGKTTIIGTGGECTACHDDATGFAGTAHVKHVNATTGKGYSCATCHGATVNATPAVTDKTKHVNAQKDVSFSGSIGSNPLAGTCSTVYCHSNGKGAAPERAPTFATLSTGQCGACHVTSASMGSPALINTNGHFAHFSSTASSYGPMFTRTSATGCQNCHTYTTELAATHVDGTIDVKTCTPCHNNAGTYTWTAGRLACSSCHDGTRSVIGGLTAPAINQTLFTTKGHGQFNSYTCTNCHNASSRHINGLVGDKRLDAALGSGNDNTECTGCHNDEDIVTTLERRNMTSHVIAKDATPAALCVVCHTAHGTSNKAMLKTTINGKTIIYTNSSTAFVSKVAVNGFYNGICQVCHTTTNYFRNTTTSAVALPTDLNGGHYSDRDCLDCHSHKGSNFAFEPVAGGCGGCHGYPPKPIGFVSGFGNYSDAKFEDFTGGGGAHVKAGHIKPSARQSEGWSNCTPCHQSNSHARGGRPIKRAFINITSPNTYRFNPAKPTSYSGNHSTTVGTCSNVSCHFQTTPQWDRP